MLALQKLAAIGDRGDYLAIVSQCMEAFAERMDQLPQAVPLMLLSLDFSLHAPLRVVIRGDRSDPTVQDLVRAAHSVYQPNKVVLGTKGALDPFVQSLGHESDTVKAFLCTGHACQEPTSDAVSVSDFLQS